MDAVGSEFMPDYSIHPPFTHSTCFSGLASVYEECAKHKIPVIHYEPGELEAELEALRYL